MGDLPHLVTPNTPFFFHFFFKTLRLILDVVPCYRAHHRTPNIVSISIMHSHSCHVMCWCIMQCNHAIAYPYHAIHIRSAICAFKPCIIHASLGNLYQKHTNSGYHFTHVNISCKHILTFIFNMSFYTIVICILGVTINFSENM